MKNAYEITLKVITDEEGIVSSEVVRIRDIDLNKQYSEREEEEEEEEGNDNQR